MKRGRKFVLLARTENTFYFIPIGKYRNWKLEKKLSGMDIDPKTLEEENISFSTMELADLRGAAFGGVEPYDPLYLHEKGGKRQTFVLCEPLNRAYLDWFFGGVPQFQPPKDKRKRKDDGEFWRKERQDPAVKRKLQGAVWAFRVLETILGVWFWCDRELWLLWACVGCLLITVLLDVFFPAYFTLMPAEKGQTKDRRYAISLVYSAWVPAIAMVYLPTVNYQGQWEMMKTGIFFALAAAAALLLAEEFRRKPEGLFWQLAFCLVFCLALLFNMNVLFPQPEPERSYVSVLDTSRHTSRYSSTYYCEILRSDGMQISLVVDGETYKAIAPGDTVVLASYGGALGYPYQIIETE